MEITESTELGKVLVEARVMELARIRAGEELLGFTP